MTYIVCRLYAGSSQRSVEELSNITKQELVPQLNEAGGLLRYITLQTDDGRVGSYSAYEDQSAAERGRKIATEWVGSTGVMSDFKVSETFEGELLLTVSGQSDLRAGAVGTIRIYNTVASDADLKAAIEEVQQEVRTITGLIRFNLARLSSGTAGTFASFETSEQASRLTEIARESRAKSDSKLAKACPQDPQQINVTLVDICV